MSLRRDHEEEDKEELDKTHITNLPENNLVYRSEK